MAGPVLLDDVARVGVAVLVALRAAAWVTRTVEHVRVALLPGCGRLVLRTEQSS